MLLEALPENHGAENASGISCAFPLLSILCGFVSLGDWAIVSLHV